MKDYYDILGISKTASLDEIKKAYRKVEIKYHPDKNPDDKSAEEKFKEAAEAYSVLSNSDKKKKYDQLGHQGYQQFGSQGQGFSGGINVHDIFSSVFGGGRSNPFSGFFEDFSAIKTACSETAVGSATDASLISNLSGIS